MLFNYDTYENEPFFCQECGWSGRGRDLIPGDFYERVSELICPACKAYMACYGYQKADSACPSHIGNEKLDSSQSSVE